MKKLLTFVVVIIALISSLNVHAESTNESFERNLLYTLGIFSKSDLEINDDEYITRGEFVSKVVHLVKAENYYSDVSSPIFTDVEKVNLYYKDLISAYNSGIVYVDKSGCFSPNDPITYPDALVFLTRALGYGTFVVDEKTDYSKAQYYAGYLKLTQNVNVNGNLVNKENEAVLLYNALDSKILEVQFTSDGNKIKKESEENLLYKLHDVYCEEGIVEADATKSLNGNCLSENKVIIDGEQYECYENYDYVGYNVKLYYQDDGNEKTIVYMHPVKNEVKNFKCEEVVNYDDNKLTVYESDKKTKKYSISKSSSVLYNSSLIKDVNSIHDKFVNSQTGTITLIDNNRDGAFDACYINSYINCMVSSVDSDNNKVYFKNGDTLSLDDYSNVKIFNGENVVGINDIKFDQILTVYKPISSDDVMYIYICSKSFDGTVKKIDTNDRNILIDDESEYKLSFSSDISISNININEDYTFYLNNYDEIVYVRLKGSNHNISYLIKVYPEEDIYTRYKMRYLSENGKVETAYLAKKVTLRAEDGSDSQKTAEQIYNYFCKSNTFKRQPILFDVNSNGEIKKVWVLSNNENDFFHKYSTTMNEIGLGGVWHFRGGPKSFNSTYSLKNSTVVFSVPKTSETNVEDNYFTTETSGYFIDNEKYSMSTYFPTFIMINKDSLAADIIVWEKDSSTVKALSSDAFAVLSICDCYDEKTDVLGKQLTICSMLNGSTQNIMYESDDGTILDQNGTTVKEGDIIRYELNFNNNTEQNKIKVIYVYDQEKLVSTVEGSQYRHDFARFSKIDVIAKDEDYIRTNVYVGISGNSTTNETYNLSSANVLKLNLKKNTVAKLSQSYVKEGDTALIYTRDGNVCSVLYYE